MSSLLSLFFTTTFNFTYFRLSHKYLIVYSLLLSAKCAKSADWDTAKIDSCDESDPDCYDIITFSTMTGDPDVDSKLTEMYSFLDDKIDNGDGGKTGTIRLDESTVVYMTKIPRKYINP